MQSAIAERLTANTS